MNWQNYFFLGMDQKVSEYFHFAASERGVDFFSVFTHLGNWRLVAFLAAAAIFLFWKYKKKEYAIPFAIVLLGGQLSGSILKRIFERPRPEWGIHAGQFDSFPSGHAIVSVLFYGFLIYFVYTNFESKKIKFFCAAAGLAIIAIIGFSRLYLGAHYVSDVAAGFLLGTAWIVAVIKFQSRK